MSQDKLNFTQSAKPSSGRLLAIVLTAALLITIWSLTSFWWDGYQVVRDTQNFYWLARAKDPALFAKDYLYISSNYIVETNILGFHFLFYPLSPGYGAFYYLASAVLDFIWLAKLTGLMLICLSVIYLFKLGRFLGSDLTGVSLSLMFVFFALASPLSTSIVSGLQRAFSLPLFIIFLYYFIRRQYVWAAALMFISALIYLPNFPPMALVYGLSFIKVERPLNMSINFSRAGLLPLAVSLALSALIVGLALAVQLNLISAPPPPAFAPDASAPVDVADNPNYQSGGSMALFTGFPFLGRAGVFDTGGDVTNFLVLFIFAGLIYKTVGRQSLRQTPKEIWYLLIAGFMMYALSLFFVFGLSSFALYLPSRYTRSTLLLFMLYFVGLNWVDFLGMLPRWLRQKAGQIIFFFLSLGVALAIVYIFSPNRGLLIPTFWLLGIMVSGLLTLLGGSAIVWIIYTRPLNSKPATWGSALVLSGIVLTLGALYINVLGVKTTNPSAAERAIYQYVAALPKNTVLAGNPAVMTNIPLFSRRSVLFRDLFPRTDAPIVPYFDAQYAETAAPMLNFCQRYQIDYLVLDMQDFSPQFLQKENFFYQPWNDQIVTRIAGRSNFALPQLEPVFASGPYRVIRCDAETLLAGAR